MAFALVAAALGGCWRSSIPMGRVSGHVTVEGQPATGGVVYFVPERGPSAAGRIDARGAYSLRSRVEGDGVVVGRQRVYFGPAVAPPDPSKPMVFVPPAPPTFPPLQYLSPETSGLTVEVRDGSNTLDFDLRKAAAPTPSP